MIRCVDVHKAYTLAGRQVQALRGVSLSITDPGFYAIMGASGSGKSTLLHLLAALDKPDQGAIAIGGRQLESLSERELTLFRRTGVGIIFQQFNLIPTLTALENVELPGMLAGDDMTKITARAKHLMETLGVADRAAHRPDSLSGGEQQRVAIARALLYKPPVILADEPTGALDSKSAEALWTLLAQIARDQHITVVMVTHEPAAAAHCREIYVLQDGRITGSINTEKDQLDARGVAARYQQLVA